MDSSNASTQPGPSRSETAPFGEGLGHLGSPLGPPDRHSRHFTPKCLECLTGEGFKNDGRGRGPSDSLTVWSACPKKWVAKTGGIDTANDRALSQHRDVVIPIRSFEFTKARHFRWWAQIAFEQQIMNFRFHRLRPPYCFCCSKTNHVFIC